MTTDERPYKPEMVRQRVHEFAAKGNDAPGITRGHCGAITGRLIKICGNDFERYRLLYYLFPYRWPALTSVTSKSLKNWDWYGLYKWTNIHKDEELNEWVCHEALLEEINLILALDIEGEAVNFDPDKIPDNQHNQQELMKTLGVAIEEGGVEKEIPEKTQNQRLKELGYEPDEERAPHQAYDPTRGMPYMQCGHEADKFSPLGLPYCGGCAQLPNVPEAYQQRSAA